MIKKIFALLLTMCLVLSVAACSAPSSTDTGTPNNTPSEQTSPTNESNNQQSSDVSNAGQSSGNAEKTEKLDSLKDFESIVVKNVEDSIASMTKEMEALAIEIDSFEKYKENEDKIQGFYDMICTETLRLEICLMEHAVAYTEFVMESESDFEDKYDDLDELYDIVYEDAGGQLPIT